MGVYTRVGSALVRLTNRAIPEFPYFEISLDVRTRI